MSSINKILRALRQYYKQQLLNAGNIKKIKDLQLKYSEIKDTATEVCLNNNLMYISESMPFYIGRLNSPTYHDSKFYNYLMNLFVYKLAIFIISGCDT